jgi:tRNA-2-methylthio-N6-dimethylallyladenosine synthase
MIAKSLYIHTIGCQMNVYDSNQISGRLMSMGYQPASAPEAADLIIVNTCTIRAKAEQKAYSLLGRLARLKKNKKDLIIAVGGCVAQQDGNRIIRRHPFVDLVFGTQALARLPDHIRQIQSRRCQIVDVEMAQMPEPFESVHVPQQETAVSRFVTIMRGCDNYCSYCVVPYVRGRETSRHPDKIVQEIKGLVAQGTKEVILLGQNVNSYGKKQGLCSFPELLARINDIPGLYRIRFTTSHPKDFNEDLILCFKNLKKLCHHIHLPIQSGSNKVLRAMNRKYTRELYLDKVAKLRDTCSNIAITSDIIVGFPGETEAEFTATLDLIKAVKFDGIFAFNYSDRPIAPAVRFADKIPESQKNERLQVLLATQEDITKGKNQALVGSVQNILVDGLSKKQAAVRPQTTNGPSQWTGRTATNKIVNFNNDHIPEDKGDVFSGKLLDVRIEKAFSHSLWGEPITVESKAEAVKGAESYAA